MLLPYWSDVTENEIFSNNEMFVVTESSYYARYHYLLFFGGESLEANDKKYSNASGCKGIYLQRNRKNDAILTLGHEDYMCLLLCRRSSSP